MTFSAFYPTSDWWFWVAEEPPWESGHPPDPVACAEFMKKVIWRATTIHRGWRVC